MYNDRLWLYACAVLCVVLSGCRTTKESSEEPAAKLKAEAEFFGAIDERAIRFRTLSAKIQVELSSSSKEFGSRAQLKLHHNDRLQISVQPIFGIEMFRLEVSRDSVKALDRMNKRYFAESITELKEQKQFDFTFENLQALLTNRLFLPGQATVDATDRNRFDWERTDIGYRLRTTDAGGMQYRFTTDREARLCSTEIDDGNRHSLTWLYTSFDRMDDGRIFPTDMNVSIDENKLSIHFNKIEFDRPVEMSFSIPENYERVRPEQIMKLLKP